MISQHATIYSLPPSVPREVGSRPWWSLPLPMLLLSLLAGLAIGCGGEPGSASDNTSDADIDASAAKARTSVEEPAATVEYEPAYPVEVTEEGLEAQDIQQLREQHGEEHGEEQSHSTDHDHGDDQNHSHAADPQANSDEPKDGKEGHDDHAHQP